MTAEVNGGGCGGWTLSVAAHRPDVGRHRHRVRSPADQPTPAPQTPAPPRPSASTVCRPAGPRGASRSSCRPSAPPSLDLDVLAVGGGTPEARPWASTSGVPMIPDVALGVAPAGHAAGGEELAAGGVEPPEVVPKNARSAPDRNRRRRCGSGGCGDSPRAPGKSDGRKNGCGDPPRSRTSEDRKEKTALSAADPLGEMTPFGLEQTGVHQLHRRA